MDAVENEPAKQANGVITRAQIKSGVVWIAVISVLRDGLQFAVTLLLVRLLDQRAYGEFALASSMVSLVTVISFHSFLEYTVQARPGEPVDYQAHFTWGGFAQLFAIVMLNAVALVMRHFSQYAPVAPLVSVMSVLFVLDWAGELRIRMLERELAWSRLRTLETIGLFASAAAALGLAWAGAGVYALLLPPLLLTVPFIYDLFVVFGWRPDWSFNWLAFQPAWHYGLTRIGSGLVARGQQALENGVLAAAVGLATLGVYGRAIGLASFCCLKLTSVLTLTLFPMVTRLAPGSAEFARASSLVLRTTAWTAVPVAAILAPVAEQVVRALYGPKWVAVASLLPWALAITALAAVMEACAFLLVADQSPRKALVLDVFNLVGMAICLVALLPLGLRVFLAGQVAVQLFLAGLSVAWLYRRGALDRNAITTALGIPGALWLLLLIGSPFLRIDSLLHAVGLALFCVIFYGLGLLLLRRDAFQEMLRFLPGFRTEDEGGN